MIGSVRQKILDWYNDNKRDFPWRGETDPYRIWLSEIILQQTRVEQGLPYYLSFIERFPDVLSLANAPEEDVLRTWQGLGYYSRARNLHHTAKTIVFEHGGNFPSEYSELLKLKGVGDYTASAISSIAFNKPHAVLDGNVFRLIARLFAIDTPVNEAGSRKFFAKYANELLCKKNPGDFNQAMMDFGSRQCSPASPACGNCPLNTYCKAFALGKVGELPIKIKPKKQRERYFHYFFLENEGSVYLRKRSKGDIWQNLYELPLVETQTGHLAEDEAEKYGLMPSKYTLLSKKKHVLSHQVIHANFYKLKSGAGLEMEGLKLTKLQEINNLPFPVLIVRFLNDIL